MADAEMAEAEDDWDLPPRVALIPELHLDGPMDLLLDLAERQRFDLGRILVLDLVEQFVAAMDGLAGQVTPERHAEWLVLARSPAEAQNAEQEAAVEKLRLAQRLQMRTVVAWLAARPHLGRDVFARPLQRAQGRTETTMALMEACLAVLRRPNNRPEAAPVYRPVLARLWRVEQAVARIRQMLVEDPEGGELAHFLPAVGQRADQQRQARGAVAGTFVACLELARQGEVEAEQNELFEPVRIRLPRTEVEADLSLQHLQPVSGSSP